ncbi:MAG: PilZ domain-containing protein [Fimbriimonadaceae bacterium]
MARIGLGDFVGTRCRFHRMKDARIFNGWIISFMGRNITVRVATDAPLAIDEEFRFETYGDKMLATFAASLREIHNFQLLTDGLLNQIEGSDSKIITANSIEIRLQTLGDIRFNTSPESVRFRVDQWPCNVSQNGQSFQAQILDIGRNGVAISSTSVCEPGSNAKVEVHAPHGVTRAEATVKYCRSNPDRPSEYRIGLEFGELGRIDKQRWESEIRNSA